MPSLPQLIEEDIVGLNRGLDDLVSKSDATTAVIIDKGGFVITKRGDADRFDLMTLAALAAASFAATESIAGLVGEQNFSNVYQQGETYSLLVVNVDAHCLLAIVFKATISVGAVKYYSVETLKLIAHQMNISRTRDPDSGLDLSLANMADATPLFQKKAC